MKSENNSAFHDAEGNILGPLIRKGIGDIYLLTNIFEILQKLLIVSVSLADLRKFRNSY